MAENFAAQAGSGQINLFEVYSNCKEYPLDVASACIELNYYESILDPTVRAEATFVDAGYRKDGEDGSSIFEKDDINMTSGEKVFLKITDGYETQLSFIDDKELRINGDPSASSQDVNKVVFSVDMYSKEAVTNTIADNWVYGRYDGKISDSVTSILQNCLKTPKEIIADPVLNGYNFLGHAEKSFYLCTLLAKKSVPDIPNALGNLAGYLFYETYDGYNFRSIDMMFMKEPKRKLIYNQLIGEIPEGYDGKILDYSFMGTINLDNVVQSGALTRTRQQKFDRFSNRYGENSDAAAPNSYNVDNNAGLEKPKIACDLLEDENGELKVTRHINSRMADTGILPTGGTLARQIERSQEENFDMDAIVRQSIMRYNQLYSNKMSIAIAGDFSLRAGDLIYCDFPEVSGKTSKVVSQKVGGIYMIADVCHRITKNNCYTRLNLVRDSIYRKPFK